MKIIALYEGGQAIKELNRFETMSIDIVNAAIASQQPNLFDDIVNASKQQISKIGVDGYLGRN
jgi:hypothetical protein